MHGDDPDFLTWLDTRRALAEQVGLIERAYRQLAEEIDAYSAGDRAQEYVRLKQAADQQRRQAAITLRQIPVQRGPIGDPASQAPAITDPHSDQSTGSPVKDPTTPTPLVTPGAKPDAAVPIGDQKRRLDRVIQSLLDDLEIMSSELPDVPTPTAAPTRGADDR